MRNKFTHDIWNLSAPIAEDHIKGLMPPPCAFFENRNKGYEVLIYSHSGRCKRPIIEVYAFGDVAKSRSKPMHVHYIETLSFVMEAAFKNAEQHARSASHAGVDESNLDALSKRRALDFRRDSQAASVRGDILASVIRMLSKEDFIVPAKGHKAFSNKFNCQKRPLPPRRVHARFLTQPNISRVATAVGYPPPK